MNSEKETTKAAKNMYIPVMFFKNPVYNVMCLGYFQQLKIYRLQQKFWVAAFLKKDFEHLVTKNRWH